MSTTTTVLAAAWDAPATGADAVAILQHATNRHGGTVARQHEGRATSLFGSAVAAARAAIECQQRMPLRVALAVGEREEGQVTAPAAERRANALVDTASPGEIVGDEVVRLLLAGSDVTIGGPQQVDLGDAGGTIDVVRIQWDHAAAADVLRVIVADDAALIRAGIVRLLQDEGFDVIAEVGDATALLDAVDASPPDLVITDVRMPPDGTDDGLRAAATIRAQHPNVSVLVLSQYVEASAAASLLDARAAGIGYLLKERVGELDEFVATCRSVAAGGRAVDPTVGEQLLQRRRDDELLARLSEREREVLASMAEGRSNAAIASSLAMSAKTLEAHVRSIFQKLELPASPDDHRRVAAVIRWLGST